MSNLPMILMNGLTYAGLLFICASGFTLIFGLLRVVNMSHGVFYLIGAYIGLVVWHITDNWALAILAGGLAVAGIAIIFKLSLLDRVIGSSERETLLTLGLNMAAGDFLLAVFGGTPQTINAPEIISQTVEIGDFKYPGTRLFLLVIAIAIFIALWLLIQKTKFGQVIRAGVDDRTTTAVMGINIKLVLTLVFGLGGLLAGISGVLGGSYLAFAPGSTEMSILTYSLVVVILGGMGSLKGAAIGAVIIGVLDSITKAYISNFAMVVIFGTLMVMLAIKPQGMFGREN